MTILAACRERLLEQRNREISEAEAKTAKLRAAIPGLAAVDAAIAAVPSEMLEAAQRPDFDKTSVMIKEKTSSLWAKRDGMLAANGYAADFDAPRYSCPLCNDNGYIGYKMCSCLRRMTAEEGYRRSGLGGALDACSFESFSLSYYPEEPYKDGRSARAVMEGVLNRCKRFASCFNGGGESLVFMGGTGLGKTHLSAAIGSEVIKKGYTVIYESARGILDENRGNAFNGEDNDLGRFTACDLLLIDDLGSEPRGDFSAAVFTDIIDKRMLAHKSTVISTNLSAGDIVKQYSPRFASRVMCGFTLLIFAGKDIRMQKLTGGK